LRVLCEGGGELAGEWIRCDRADELIFFIAPKILGGDARPAVGGRGWTLATAPGWVWEETRRVGGDLLVRAVREAGGQRCLRD